MPLRCFLPAWITAWFTAVFLTSALIAYSGISRAATVIGTGFHRLPASTWKVADDVGPAVKLMMGGFLLVGFWGLRQASALSWCARYATSILIGLIAVAATIGLVPSTLSRGFAAALTGARFDATTTIIYLLGGVLAGLVFVVSCDRCTRGDASKRRRSADGLTDH